ncbi:MFS transporter [Paenibacillus arenosi]|uniref:MFS transporter n=1 Tax=Paenibacillus arenosi TaxID=2774142 RepID=A0ABR9AT76_9BACL|nr:MFS transporter [Paenibacillus arenosi]MBD8497319.1 MFS transporter [Paenibacillus arenosi]
MDEQKKLDLVALASIPLIMTLANSMLIPVLPLMQKKLGITTVMTSLIITVYAAVSIVCIPIAGYLSDRYGRKLIIIIGLSIAAVGGVISGWSAWQLDQHAAYIGILIGRFIQGIGAAGAFPIVLPLVGDMFRSDEQVSSSLGMIETSNTFGKVVSPILGSALTLVVWFLPLAIIPVFCAISIAAIAIFVKVPNKNNQQKITFKAFLHDVGDILYKDGRWLYAIFAIGGIAMYIMFGFLYHMSTMLEEKYGIDGIKKGALLAVPLCAICIASFVTGKLIGTNKCKMKWFNFTGTVMLTGSMSMFLFMDTTKLLTNLILLSIGGLGIGLILPSLDALITEGIDKKQRGTITSLYSSMRFIGVAAGPLITSFFLDNDKMVFYIFTGAGLLCCGIALFAIHPSSKEQQEEEGLVPT